MKEITLRELFRNTDAYAGQEVLIKGWVRNNRNSNKFGFIELNDGSFFKSVQVVYEEAFLDNYEEIARSYVGSALAVRGEVVLTPNAKQPFEIKAKQVAVEGTSTPDYPLQPKRHSMEFLREIGYLRPRTNMFSAVFRVRSLVAYAIHKFFQDQDFVYVHTPEITASDAEGAGEMFQVTTLDLENLPRTEDGKIDYSQDFFGKKTSLTVSGQLEAEIFALAFRNVYTFGPTFRAEKSGTVRHVAEFWHVEPEVCFVDLDGIIEIAEDFIKSIIRYTLEHCPTEMAFCDRFVEKGLLDKLNYVVNTKFARVTYTEAVEILQNCGKTFEFPVSWGADLQSEHERYLTDEHFGCPVFVTDYPKDIKSFYMKQNSDGKTVAATDLLVPTVGEIIGCSERETDLDKLTQAMIDRHMPLENYRDYLDTRKYGTVEHSGFGLGFDRMVMYVTGISNIRDVLQFPRAYKKIY